MLASPVGVLVQIPPAALLINLLANALVRWQVTCIWEARIKLLVQPGPDAAVVAICGANQCMEDSFSPLSLSAFQIGRRIEKSFTKLKDPTKITPSQDKLPSIACKNGTAALSRLMLSPFFPF